MRVAFVVAEAVPFVKTGGLGDVGGALPLELGRAGLQVDVYMPGYGCINRRVHKIKKLSNALSYKKISKNVTVYFVENAAYFLRQGVYGSSRGGYKDNLKRFKFFNVQVLETLRRHGKTVDVIHCHDWHASLIPVYLKEVYQNDPFFKKTRTLLTIHNLAFQGFFPAQDFKVLGLNEKLFNPRVFEFYGNGNLLKAGIIYSDGISTVSPRYASEIQTKKYGCGLERALRKNKSKLFGILNGLDYSIWHPKEDQFIQQPFDQKNAAGAKWLNKTELKKQLGLNGADHTPLYGSVGRLSHQKGMDLVLDSLEGFMKHGAHLVVQGVGDAHYARRFKKAAGKYRGRFAFVSDFDEKIAHQIYAASDFFLMPSNFEPCGLSQMISMCYGAIPIVYKTGGLADTVKSYEQNKAGNGIVFDRYSRKGLTGAFHSSLKLYRNPKRLRVVQANGMKETFTWKASAREYIRVYRCLL